MRSASSGAATAPAGPAAMMRPFASVTSTPSGIGVGRPAVEQPRTDEDGGTDGRGHETSGVG